MEKIGILKIVVLFIFIGRTEAEAPILWPPDEKSLKRLIQTLGNQGEECDHQVEILGCLSI